MNVVKRKLSDIFWNVDWWQAFKKLEFSTSDFVASNLKPHNQFCHVGSSDEENILKEEYGISIITLNVPPPPNTKGKLSPRPWSPRTPHIAQWRKRHYEIAFESELFNPIPTGQGQNQPLYERHVTHRLTQK